MISKEIIGKMNKAELIELLEYYREKDCRAAVKMATQNDLIESLERVIHVMRYLENDNASYERQVEYTSYYEADMLAKYKTVKNIKNNKEEENK